LIVSQFLSLLRFACNCMPHASSRYGCVALAGGAAPAGAGSVQHQQLS
jgi:hypothetical protein